MTKERAIEILERRTTIPDGEYTWEQINQAIDMAICQPGAGVRGREQGAERAYCQLEEVHGPHTGAGGDLEGRMGNEQ